MITLDYKGDGPELEHVKGEWGWGVTLFFCET